MKFIKMSAPPIAAHDLSEPPKSESDFVSSRVKGDPSLEKKLLETRLMKRRRNWYEHAGRPLRTQKS